MWIWVILRPFPWTSLQVWISPKKIKAVLHWPVSNTCISLQRFLGLKQFFRGFNWNYSLTPAPLTFLTFINNAFSRTTEADRAFNEQKNQILTSSYPYPGQPPQTICSIGGWFWCWGQCCTLSAFWQRWKAAHLCLFLPLSYTDWA